MPLPLRFAMPLLLRWIPTVPRVHPCARSAFPWNVSTKTAAVPLRRVVVNQRAFSRRSNPLFAIRADYKIAAPHASRIDVLSSTDFASVLCKSSGKSDLCGLPHVDGLHGIVGEIERIDAKQIGSVMLQKRMHGRPLELVNGLPSVGQGKVEGEVVLVAHRRRVARDSRRCKFLGLRAILHHEGIKYIIPLFSGAFGIQDPPPTPFSLAQTQLFLTLFAKTGRNTVDSA